MQRSDVFSLTKPLQILGLTIVISSMAFSAFTALTASEDPQPDEVFPNSQEELWKIN